MVDLSSIQSAYSALQSAGQIVKAMLELRDAQLLSEKARELSGFIIAAQSQTLEVQAKLSTAVEEVRELKERLMQMQNWETEKARYELKEVATGRFAYAIRETQRGMEPPHCLCANCYERGLKSILQEEHLAHGRTHLLVCHACKADVVIKGLRQRGE
jgi:hypothetical protein